MDAETISKNGASSKSQTSRENILRKVLLSAVYFIYLSCTCFAQDIIITKDSRKINAKVTEVNVDNVRYKNFDNQDGPIYTILKSDIASILYQNAQVESFETVNTAPSAPTQTMSENNLIETLNAKELEKVLTEALENVLYFESLSAELLLVEGLHEFFNEWLESKEGKRAQRPFIDKVPWYNYNGTAEQKFIELTGWTYAELSPVVDECLGPPRRPLWDGKGHVRLDDKNNLKKFLDNCCKKQEDLKTDFDLAVTEIEKSVVMKIPDEYRCSFALETMLNKFVRNRRASTWKECANLYEDQLHKWRLEMNMEENLRVQRDIRNYTRATARNTRATAIFSGLIWLGI